MKKLIQIFTVLSYLMVFGNDANAMRIITTSYHKSCFIGCGSVDKTSTSATISLPDGTTELVILRTVSYTGFGFNACPSSIPASDNPNWLEAANDVMFSRAIDAIYDGSTSGTYSRNFLNVSTGQMITFYVDWNVTFNDVGEIVSENIEVYYLN
jgi:hypothetical protein